MNVYTIALFGSALMAAVLAFALRRRRHAVGGHELLLLALAAAVWSLMAALESIAIERSGKIFWSVMSYFGSQTSPLLFFLFALRYTRQDRWLPPRRVIWFWVIPCVSILMAATNQWHFWLWRSITLVDGAFGVQALYQHGVWFWVLITYNYSLLLLSILALFRAVSRLPKLYTSQANFLLIVALAPLTVNGVYVFNPELLGGLEPTPIALTVSILLLALVIYRYHLLDWEPVARAVLIDQLREGSLFTDVNQRIGEVNPAALRMFGLRKDILGRTTDEVFADLPQMAALCRADHETEMEVWLDGEQPRCLELHLGLVSDRTHQIVGRLLMLHDITTRKQVEETLAYSAEFQRILIGLATQFVNVPVEMTDQAIHEALQAIGLFARVDRAYVFFCNLNAGTLSNTHEWCADGIEPQIDNLQNLPIQLFPEVYQRHQAGEIVLIPRVADLDPESSLRLTLEPQGIQALVLVPLMAGQAYLGFVGFDAVRAEKHWTDTDLSLLKVLAELITNAELRRRSAAALQESERKYRLIAENTADNLWIMDLNLQLTYCSPSVLRIRGYTPEEAITQTLDQTLTPESLKKALVIFEEEMALELIGGADTQRVRKFELEMLHKNGSRVWVDTSISFLRDEQLKPVSILSVSREITDRKLAEQAEQAHRQMADALRETATLLTSSLSLDDVLDQMIENIQNVLSYDAASIMLFEGDVTRIVRSRGFSERGLEDYIRKWRLTLNEVPDLRQAAEAAQTLIIPDVSSYDAWVDYPETRWIRSHIAAPIRIHDRAIGFLNLASETPGFFREEHAQPLQAFADQAAIAIENARLYGEVQRLARVDELTRLQNRRGLFELGQREVDRARRYKRPLSALFLDIDHFRDFNNRYSYAVGDKVLRSLAECMHASTREVDVIGRYGGEEFVILLTETDQANALEIAERLRVEVESKRLSTEWGELSVTVSIGVAQLRTRKGKTEDSVWQEQNSLADLIDRASQALHAAKAAGRNCVVAGSA
ncbi:MAG: histidine kinase N-terminal 7TM domain-containing protein [Anaerolineaceae bacterium]|nr:histidine kinase N-terminal 7TM domain-containing protein [Anaerolineaceae bacterium]